MGGWVGRYVCMYACMHVCMYACMHVCMYACMHVCMYTYIQIELPRENNAHLEVLSRRIIGIMVEDLGFMA